MATFVERLLNACETNRSLLCVGLDPDPDRMPIRDVVAFNSAIVDATHDLVCAYKPNIAFYEARGSEGIGELERTIAHIRDVAPSVIILIDGKRGDIGSTNEAYAKALFETWGADAATINAYAGGTDLQPFLATRTRPCSCGAGHRTRVQPNCRICPCSLTARRCPSTKRLPVVRSSGTRKAP